MTNKTFDGLGLSQSTLAAIKQINYISPMPVQEQVIPLALTGKDIIASAQTGSGKTAAFTIPLLDILTQNPQAKCLVVAPTRELAQQIFKVFGELSVKTDVKSTLIVGGKFMQDQLKKLKKSPRFVIGTPGRLNDHIKRKSLVLSDFKYVVWDEMDRMLALGFIHQIEHIMQHLPKQRQTLMFSATFPKRVLSLAEMYLTEPQKVIIDSLNSVSANIEQKVLPTEHNLKNSELKKIIAQTQGQLIVFVKTQKMTETVAKALTAEGQPALALHGALRQSKRESIIRGFRENEFRTLVATDVAARGLDIPKIACVVNYDLPQSPEEYIHRIGRTGRVNQKGLAITILLKSDKKHWKEITDFLASGDEKPLSAQEEKHFNDMLEKERKNSNPFSLKERKDKEFNRPARRLDTRPKSLRKEEHKREKFVPQHLIGAQQKEHRKDEHQNKYPKQQKPATAQKQQGKNFAPKHDAKQQQHDGKHPHKGKPQQKHTQEEYAYSPFKKVAVGNKKKGKKGKPYGREVSAIWQKILKTKHPKFNGGKFRNKNKKR